LDKDKRNWQRMRFKQNKVWLATDQEGKPVIKNGKVLIKYQLNQDYEYWVHRKSVRPLDALPTENQDSDKKPPQKKKSEPSAEMRTANENMSDSTVRVYTDGSSSGNPGPSGIGVLLRYGEYEKEISKYIGIKTNNIAELEAIQTGLLELKKKDLPVRIFTDSSYAYGVLSCGWKARKNRKLINSIKKIISTFKDLKVLKIEGHRGHEGNERADFLATSAIKRKTK
jgi:ribonuclease HI